jgi:predicted AAA+ superfamily ATPase
MLRGARQVGKTHAVRTLGKTFTHFIEVNLETNEEARIIMEEGLDVERIIKKLSNLYRTKIIPGSTLLFFDEIQTVPKAIIALRYFYELMPKLHVLAAGSLVDFAIAQVGIPVGRVTTLYVYPMSFLEFLVATGHAYWVKVILENDQEGMSEGLHNKLIELVGAYIAIGGMPEAVKAWAETSLAQRVKEVHTSLLFAYKQDFERYAKQNQIAYLDLVYSKAIFQLSKKFKFAQLGEYRKRELAPALELLEKAGLYYPVMKSAAQGIPIGGQADFDDFKLIFLDVGLTQALLNFDITAWILESAPSFINKGEIIEAFVGQEILAYSDPIKKEYLFYWRRETKGSEAEVDYLYQIKENVIPIEVKSGPGSTLKSMHLFLESHPKSPYGIRFSTQDYSQYENIKSYPLYAIIKLSLEHDDYGLKAVQSLFE